MTFELLADARTELDGAASLLTDVLGDGDEMHEMRTRQASDRVPQALGAEHWPCRMVQSVLR